MLIYGVLKKRFLTFFYHQTIHTIFLLEKCFQIYVIESPSLLIKYEENMGDSNTHGLLLACVLFSDE